MTNDLSIALVGLAGTSITAATTVVAVLIRQRYKALQAKKACSFSNTIPAIHEVYSLLNRLVRETKAHRAIILKAENGGGRPKVGSPLKSSVIYEVYENELGSTRYTWQKQELDEEYISVLSNLFNSKDRKIIVTPDKLHDGSILKDNYIAHGIVRSELIEVVEREREYLYLSLNYTDPSGESAHQADVKRAVYTKLRHIFRKYEGI